MDLSSITRPLGITDTASLRDTELGRDVAQYYLATAAHDALQRDVAGLEAGADWRLGDPRGSPFHPVLPVGAPFSAIGLARSDPTDVGDCVATCHHGRTTIFKLLESQRAPACASNG